MVENPRRFNTHRFSLLPEVMMAVVLVRCPHCHTTDVIKHGVTDQGKQRYRCQNANGPSHTFIIDYSYKGRLPAIKQQIIEMALHGSGIRDIARVLKISQTTVMETLKKRCLNSSMSIMRS
jgi:insertion element IS1 protein InsB